MKDKRVRNKKIIYNSIIIFNILFIVVLIAYYGYRLVYYYQLEHQPAKEIKYLSEKITSQNELVNEGDGLYFDEDEEMFYFKGNVTNNYLSYSNQLWRIMKINKDGSIVLILDDPITAMTYGTTNEYQTSFVRNYLNQIESEIYTGIFERVLIQPEIYLTNTSICTDTITNIGDIHCNQKANENLIGLLNLSDYDLSGGKNGYLNSNISYYTATKGNNNQLYYVHAKGGVTLTSDFSEHNYGIRPAITLKSEIDYLSGDGSESNPYVIEPSSDTKTIQVGNYVSYSGYTWKVISKDTNTYKLATTSLLTDTTGQAYTRNYSSRTNIFTPTSYGSLAYYLNRTWYRTLDTSLIVDGTWYIGNYQQNGVTNYQNIYTDSVTAKVGLLSVGEFYSLEVPNTWLMTSLNEDDDMIYTVQEGSKYYSDVIDGTHGIRPAIYITSQIQVVSGTGTVNDPYVIGGM